MYRDALLGLGLALYPATQLRLDGVPLGFGEFFLIAWLGLSAMGRFLRGPGPGNPALRRIAVFWALLGLAESIGLLSGLAGELFQDVSGMLHDVFAYSLMLALGMMISLELADARRRRRACWLVTGLGAAFLFLQLAGGFGLLPLPGLEYWNYDRFRGWSENPNQLGFVVVFPTFASLYLIQTARSVGETAAGLVCAGVALAVGIATKSDSFVVALLIGGSVWVAITALAWSRTLEAGVTLRGASVLFGLLAVPLAAAAFAPFAAATLERIEESSEAVYSNNDQGDTRLDLWQEALKRGVYSGFIGLGPGPQLVSKSFKLPPPNKWEAHNTLLDLFVQGGLLAVGAFVWLSLSTFRDVWRARLAGMAGLLCGLLAFSMFHLIVRQPVFWFGLVLCLLESACTTTKPGSWALVARKEAVP
ncbi:O-antigen ligase [Siccirubricoccus sp. G192]|uniref:O-antigen ligase family protein n=1 Tax=Siccirubricoccus sp. G192 TaxID=2849651 RepID=UPI001C2BCADC|nr:O-antigen ligase family protein [Siccirubricoccus sp. G192]MBV1797534.1 O-antigen ligase family protein [Siccirubricoccus sp. G192]